jgi:3-oxoacyl-[acyl-carrier protein] reductase
MNFRVDLAGQTAVVTGAGGGIGRAVALLLARSGADVAVTDIHEKVEPLCQLARDISVLGCKSLATSADVTDRSDVDHLLGDVLDAFGAVDLLVNVAGVYLVSPITKYSESAWDRTLAVNLKGPFLTCQAFSRAMCEQGHGNIINIASDSAIDVGEGDGPYGASKAALVLLTRHIARECGRHNVRANAIAPGWVKTDMTRFVWEHEASRKEAEASVPLGYLAEPDDIGYVVLFLASEASRYVTGQLIVVNGGRI